MPTRSDKLIGLRGGMRTVRKVTITANRESADKYDNWVYDPKATSPQCGVELLECRKTCPIPCCPAGRKRCLQALNVLQAASQEKRAARSKALLAFEALLERVVWGIEFKIDEVISFALECLHNEFVRRRLGK